MSTLIIATIIALAAALFVGGASRTAATIVAERISAAIEGAK